MAARAPERRVVSPCAFCATLTGWTEVVADAVGLVGPTVQHVECRATGGARCMWHCTWNRKVEPSAR